MPHSMTGFGRGDKVQGGRSATVEARSVNHRHLSVKWRLPSRFVGREVMLEERVREFVTRGSVDVTVRFQGATSNQSLVDRELARRYADSIAQLRSEAGEGDSATDWVAILSLPGVVSQGDSSADETDLEILDKALEKALCELVKMRKAEGARLDTELRALVASAEKHVTAITKRAAKLPASYREKLLARITELLSGNATKLDAGALEREVALFADRCDVREELARLAIHFQGFRDTLAKKGSIGRSLEFLVQEMGREANTIGSKIQDADATRHVVELKTAIERLREQVQNLE